jgi:transcriptional regulator with GAF, ATPase, and Fis domain
MIVPLQVASLELERLRALRDLRRLLETVHEPQQLLHDVCTLARRVLGFDEACLVLFPASLGAGAGSVEPARVFSVPGTKVLAQLLAQRGPGFAGALDSREAAVFSHELPLRGVCNGVRARVFVRGTAAGELWFLSLVHREHDESDVLFVQLLADEVGVALERGQLLAQDHVAALERRRLLDAEASEQLLRALAHALNIRDVFPSVSAIAQSILPHDRLTMSFNDKSGTCVLQAVSNDDGPSVVRVSGIDPTLFVDGSFKIVDDLTRDKPQATYDPPDTRVQIINAGYRSLLSVVLSARQQLFGLHFWSKQPGSFRGEHVAIARRVAEHVALAVSHQQLAEAGRRAAEAQARAERLEARVQSLSEELEVRSGYARVIGGSPAWRTAVKAATQVAQTDTTVLLTGESGTGKEVIARFIHRASGRSSGPFVAVNCAALPEQLLESELFGHERGAFTGAQQAKPGQIELAAGGVLFLDEVGEMSPSAQAKFLRVLQEREFQRLGGTRLLKANVRVIAATNRELRRALDRGDFREDLYYRLQVFEIRLPPLRERAEDVLPLSEAFLDDIGRLFGRPVAGITHEAREALLGHRWPGNVRELRNVLERAAIVSEGGLIAPEHLSLTSLDEPASLASTTNVKALERQMIEQVLRECSGNKSQAARRLGLTRKQLYVRLRQYDEGDAQLRQLRS